MAFVAFAAPAQAITCKEARALSAEELAQWGKRLALSPDRLQALLETAFCASNATPERVAERSRVRGRRATD